MHNLHIIHIHNFVITTVVINNNHENKNIKKVAINLTVTHVINILGAMGNYT